MAFDFILVLGFLAVDFSCTEGFRTASGSVIGLFATSSGSSKILSFGLEKTLPLTFRFLPLLTRRPAGLIVGIWNARLI